jgi:hypothetical protein
MPKKSDTTAPWYSSMLEQAKKEILLSYERIESQLQMHSGTDYVEFITCFDVSQRLLLRLVIYIANRKDVIYLSISKLDIQFTYNQWLNNDRVPAVENINKA